MGQFACFCCLMVCSIFFPARLSPLHCHQLTVKIVHHSQSTQPSMHTYTFPEQRQTVKRRKQHLTLMLTNIFQYSRMSNRAPPNLSLHSPASSLILHAIKQGNQFHTMGGIYLSQVSLQVLPWSPTRIWSNDSTGMWKISFFLGSKAIQQQ